MIKWLNVPDATKRNAYNQIAERTGMSPFAAEKDWWVVQTLAMVFETHAAQHLVFKGGTSLSKVWKLIERFSEDIDLAIDREFFGFKGELSKNQRDNLKKVAGKYVEDIFYPELQARFSEQSIKGIRWELLPVEQSDKDRTINLYYQNVIETPGYLEARVQIEISCRSLREPFTVQSLSSLVDENYPNQYFKQDAISIPTVNPERTFLEKIFLLHEEFQRPIERIRVDRLSRHLYDVSKMSTTEYANLAFQNKALYETIVNHRKKFTKVGGVDYNLHQPQSINPIPIPEVINAWKIDYNKMLEQMIYESNPPSFTEVIASLEELKIRVNTIKWKIDI